MRAQNLGIPTLLVPVLYLAMNVIYAVSSFPFGIISDRIGRKVVLITGFGIFFIVYLGFAFAPSALVISVLFPVYGLYYGLTDGVSKVLVSDLAPPHLKATAFGTYYFIIGVVPLPASLRGHPLADRRSYVCPPLRRDYGGDCGADNWSLRAERSANRWGYITLSTRK